MCIAQAKVFFLSTGKPKFKIDRQIDLPLCSGSYATYAVIDLEAWQPKCSIVIIFLLSLLAIQL